MKTLLTSLLFVFFIGINFLQAQKVTGNWKIEDPSKEGKKAVLKLKMDKKGNFDLDIGNDGDVDITGTYELEGDRMIIYDTGGELACDPKAKGVYRFEAKKKTLTLYTVSEECENRGAPIGEAMVFSKI